MVASPCLDNRRTAFAWAVTVVWSVAVVIPAAAEMLMLSSCLDSVGYVFAGWDSIEVVLATAELSVQFVSFQVQLIDAAIRKNGTDTETFQFHEFLNIFQKLASYYRFRNFDQTCHYFRKIEVLRG